MRFPTVRLLRDWAAAPPPLPLLLLLLLLTQLPGPSDGCARTSAGGGGGGGGTPSQECAAKNDQVPLYEDTSFAIGSNFYGEVSASSTCKSCASGATKYYPNSGKVVPKAADEKAIGALTCKNMCVCTADGTCYKPNADDVRVVLYPYCTAPTSCAVYVVVLTVNDNEGLVSTDGSSTVTSVSQVDSTTLDNYPVTRANTYPKITSASCNGCNFKKSC